MSNAKTLVQDPVVSVFLISVVPPIWVPKVVGLKACPTTAGSILKGSEAPAINRQQVLLSSPSNPFLSSQICISSSLQELPFILPNTLIRSSISTGSPFP